MRDLDQFHWKNHRSAFFRLRKRTVLSDHIAQTNPIAFWIGTNSDSGFTIHKVTMTSFAVTLYSQCCRLHVEGQQVVNHINIIRSCWSICSLFLNLIILVCYYAYSLIHLKRLFCFKFQTQLVSQHHGVYLVTEFSDVSLHLVYTNRL